MNKKKRRRFAAPNATGRNKCEPFIRITWHMYDHPAVKSLSNSAFRVWIHLHRYYFGPDSDDIAMSVLRITDEIPMSKGTAHKSLMELRDHGLVLVIETGKFRGRLASTYRLTHQRNMYSGATHEYKNWNPVEERLSL